MYFSSDASAKIEGLLGVNRDFCTLRVENPKGSQVVYDQPKQIIFGSVAYGRKDIASMPPNQSEIPYPSIAPDFLSRMRTVSVG